MTKRYRRIEMYIGVQGKGLGGRWFTTFVKIPYDTPDAKVGKVARRETARLLAKLKQEVAFIGVYHVPYPDDDGITWKLCVKSPSGDYAHPCADLEECLDVAVKQFGCTDDQVNVLRGGGVVVTAGGLAWNVSRRTENSAIIDTAGVV